MKKITPVADTKRRYGNPRETNPISAWMDKKKMTPTQAAAALGVAEFNLRNWLSGRARPDAESLTKIANSESMKLAAAVMLHYYYAMN